MATNESHEVKTTRLEEKKEHGRKTAQQKRSKAEEKSKVNKNATGLKVKSGQHLARDVKVNIT